MAKRKKPFARPITGARARKPSELHGKAKNTEAVIKSAMFGDNETLTTRVNYTPMDVAVATAIVTAARSKRGKGVNFSKLESSIAAELFAQRASGRPAVEQEATRKAARAVEDALVVNLLTGFRNSLRLFSTSRNVNPDGWVITHAEVVALVNLAERMGFVQ